MRPINTTITNYICAYTCYKTNANTIGIQIRKHCGGKNSNNAPRKYTCSLMENKKDIVKESLIEKNVTQNLALIPIVSIILL